MGIHVVIQPLAGYGAEIVSSSPGVRQLVAGGEGTTILAQVPRYGAIRAESGCGGERTRRVVRDTEPYPLVLVSGG